MMASLRVFDQRRVVNPVIGATSWDFRSYCVCPGAVESPSLAERMSAQGPYESARAAFIASQPMGRLGTPEEIGDLAVYLARATYTSGQPYAIDGGWTI